MTLDRGVPNRLRSSVDRLPLVPWRAGGALVMYSGDVQLGCALVVFTSGIGHTITASRTDCSGG